MSLPGVYATLGSSGGTLRSEDGAITIDVPAGALAADTEFRIVETPDAPPSIGLAYHVEPSVTLTQPATVTYNYASLDVGGRELTALRVARDAGGTWEILTKIDQDKTAGWVSAKDDTLSFNYGLVEEQEGVAMGGDDDSEATGGEADSGDDAATTGKSPGTGGDEPPTSTDGGGDEPKPNEDASSSGGDSEHGSGSSDGSSGGGETG